MVELTLSGLYPNVERRQPVSPGISLWNRKAFFCLVPFTPNSVKRGYMAERQILQSEGSGFH